MEPLTVADIESLPVLDVLRDSVSEAVAVLVCVPVIVGVGGGVIVSVRVCDNERDVDTETDPLRVREPDLLRVNVFVPIERLPVTVSDPVAESVVVALSLIVFDELSVAVCELDED
jgi:hypothetical protein